MDRNYRELFVRIFIGAFLIASLGSLSACGGGGSSSPLPPSPPSAFSLASPANTTPSLVIGTALSWQDSSGETSYTLQISSDNFATTGYSYVDTSIPANTVSYTLTPGMLAGGVTYSWRVIAVNATGQTTATNAPFSFTTRTETPVWSLFSNPTSSLDDEPYGMVISGSSMYVVGYDSDTALGDDQWRIENRDTSNGSLVASFGTTTGVVVNNPSGTSIFSFDDAYAIAVDSTDMYVVGFDSVAGDDDWGWHIEKRDLVTGASVTTFGTDGAISENLSIYVDEAFAVAVDSTQLYIVGYEETLTQGAQWRIEARDKSTGSLVSEVTSSLSADADYAYAIAIDPDEGYMYVAGSDASSGDWKWRIEKRTLSAPLSLETTTFGGGNGYVLSNPGTGADEPLAIALDKNTGYLYIAGYEQDTINSRYRWRIEKRRMSDGALETAQFGGTTGFVVSSTTTNAVANSIAIDSNYMYVAGYDNTSSGSFEWRIEKRDLTTGALVSSFGFGGVVVYDFGTPSAGFDDVARAIAVDSTNVYVAGYETVSGADSRWRIMKLPK